MDYRLPLLPYPIEGHAGGWKCLPFHGVKKKSNPRSIERADAKREVRRDPEQGETCRYRDVTSDRLFSSATPLTSHYEHFGGLAPLGQNILSRVRTSIKISAELGEPSSIARSDRKRLTRSKSVGSIRKVLKTVFCLVPLLASLCQGIGGDKPAV